MKLACMIPMGVPEIEAACRAVPAVTVVRVAAPADLPRVAADAEALVVADMGYTAEVAATLRREAPRLRWLQFASAGFDSALRHGVPPGVVVTSSGPAWGPIVAEHALALMLALARQLPQAERFRAQAQWQRPHFLKTAASLEGRRLTVLGFGNIGREAARRARAFGMQVTGVARSARSDPDAERLVEAASLKSVLPETDVLLIATPLTPATRGLIDAAALALMKPSALLLNVSRGGIVDEAALADALAAKRLAGAGLDVFETEPLPPDHALWRLDNVILTPHAAVFGSPAGLRRLADLTRDNAARLVAGETLRNIVELGVP